MTNRTEINVRPSVQWRPRRPSTPLFDPL
jgi:hypothetical protein